MKQQKQKIILTVVVGFFGSVCLFATYSTGFNLVEGSKAGRELKITLVNLEVMGDDTIVITFQFTNVSALDIVVQKIGINIYANKEYMGNFDMQERTTLKQGDTDIIFKAVVSPHNLPKLKAVIGNSQEIQWHIKGGAVIELPFHEMTTVVSIDEVWVST